MDQNRQKPRVQDAGLQTGLGDGRTGVMSLFGVCERACTGTATSTRTANVPILPPPEFSERPSVGESLFADVTEGDLGSPYLACP